MRQLYVYAVYRQESLDIPCRNRQGGSPVTSAPSPDEMESGVFWFGFAMFPDFAPLHPSNLRKNQPETRTAPIDVLGRDPPTLTIGDAFDQWQTDTGAAAGAMGAVAVLE